MPEIKSPKSTSALVTSNAAAKAASVVALKAAAAAALVPGAGTLVLQLALKGIEDAKAAALKTQIATDLGESAALAQKATTTVTLLSNVKSPLPKVVDKEANPF